MVPVPGTVHTTVCRSIEYNNMCTRCMNSIVILRCFGDGTSIRVLTFFRAVWSRRATPTEDQLDQLEHVPPPCGMRNCPPACCMLQIVDWAHKPVRGPDSRITKRPWTGECPGCSQGLDGYSLHTGFVNCLRATEKILFPATTTSVFLPHTFCHLQDRVYLKGRSHN